MLVKEIKINKNSLDKNGRIDQPKYKIENKNRLTHKKTEMFIICNWAMTVNKMKMFKICTHSEPSKWYFSSNLVGLRAISSPDEQHIKPPMQISLHKSWQQWMHSII